MKVFISYAAEDRDLAEQIHLALVGAGYETFFDRENLPPAGDYHARIKTAVDEADAFVFVISPNAVQPGSYALTELKHARAKWPHPKAHVLPVAAKPTAWAEIPAYLKAVTFLEPQGNVAAEVVIAIAQLQSTTNGEHTKSAQAPTVKPVTPASRLSARRGPLRWLILIAVVGVLVVAGILNRDRFRGVPDVSGRWETATITNPYADAHRYVMVFELTQHVNVLTGSTTQVDEGRKSGYTRDIRDGKISGNMVSFHTTGEVWTGSRNETRPYKQNYSGVLNAERNEIAFRTFNDLPTGGVVQSFVARRN
jgi:hypothetical protein